MTTEHDAIGRREAIRRVTTFLGGVALVGGRPLLAAVEGDAHVRAALLAESGQGVGAFTAENIAFLDEVAETILPATSTPGAKAAKVGPFMALMVTDTYDARNQQAFRAGMERIEQESKMSSGVGFVQATPRQRLALLERLDREQKAHMDTREIARKAREKDTTKKVDALQSDQRKETAPSLAANAAAAITADSPTHFFRMMKELALLGYFTSQIGYTQAQRYVESPGRYDPCVPYERGGRSWAPHA